MYKILQAAIILFVIVCITGCPPPNYYSLILDGQDHSGIKFGDSGSYTVIISDMHPWRSKNKKEITIHLDTRNFSKDTLQLICSKSVIYSKTDTFTGQNYNHNYNSLYLLKDTITLAPRGFDWFNMLFVGNKKYTARLFKQTNKKDTLHFQLNLFGKDTFTFVMRNHHRKGWIWEKSY